MFEYDGNGNMVKDLDAGILRIEYNSLNLPQMIKFSDHSKHVYTYDATGRKLRAEYHTPIMVVAEPQVPDMGEEMPEQEDVLMEEQQQEWNEEEWGEEWEMEEEELIPAEMPDENGEVVEEPLPQEENNCKPTIFFEDDDIACEVTTVDYCGDFIYVNGKLKRMLFPGGYVTFRNDSIECPEYHFYLTDHQGNVRIVANQDGTIEQINHYYPYGGLMGESTNSDHQPYKYNGKELDRHHGLDWFDYGARWYDGMRFNTIDRFAEKYPELSPYSYCAGNPIKYIDVNGDSIYFDMPIVENGEITGYTRYTYGKYGDNYGFGRNSELYQGSNTMINAISDALNKLMFGGNYGNNLISSLAGNTGIDVIIGHGYNETRHTTGSSYVMVKWNSEDYSGGLDINGSAYIEPFINLGHELIHAQNFIENTINRNPWFITPTGTTITYEEHVACMRENILRAENGFPLRKYYALYEGSQRPYLPSLITNPKCLVNLINGKK